jgi:hypothetical protein
VFERFAKQARHVIVFAQQEARELGHDYIGTEHELLGLMRERDGLAARVLGELGLTEGRAREAVVRIVGRGEASPRGQIEFTARAMAALAAAEAERLALGHEEIKTAHLLLGVLRGDGGIALRILSDAGLARETVRAEVIRMLEANPVRPSSSRAVPVESEQPRADWEARPKVEAISSEQAGSFALLRRPQQASDRLPEDRRTAVESGRIGRLGLSPALTRRVTTPAGDVWVIPGNGCIGLAVPGGMTCNPTEHAAARGIVTWGSTRTADQTMVHGLLPDEVDEITLITADGTSTTVPVNENVYGAILDGPFRAARFCGPTGTVELGPWS